MAAITNPSRQANEGGRGMRPDPTSTNAPLLLSASQEGQVRELYYKRVRQKCADEVREFATCAINRTFTATFMCRAEQKAMNQCMILHATQEEHDAARLEWFATIEQRQEEKQKYATKRKQDEKFWREWWDRDMKQKPGLSSDEISKEEQR